MVRLCKIFLIFSFLFAAGFVFAQSQEVPLPGLEGGQTPLLPDYVKYIFGLSLRIFGSIIFAVIIYAGFKFMASKGSPGQKREAIDQIRDAFLGLAVLLFVYLIFTTVNPQLVSLKLPEKVVFQPPELISFQPLSAKPVGSIELPIGGFIADLLSNERINRIKSVLDGTKPAAQKVKEVAGELRSPVVCSSCGYKPDRNACNRGFTAAGCNTFSCSSGACSGDPCPERELIRQKRGHLQDALSSLADLRGLAYWLERLKIEINGSEAEKIIGLQRELDDSKGAESLIASCPLSKSPVAQRYQAILPVNALREYQAYLKETAQAVVAAPGNFVDYLPPSNPYPAASLYCAEAVYSIRPVSISQVSLPQTKGGLGKEKTGCGQEIPLGETLDNAQELVQRIITALQELIDAINKEISSAQELYAISNEDRCTVSNCYSRTTCWCGPCEAPAEGRLNPFIISTAFAADCCPCDVTVRPCGGQIFDDNRVNQLVQEIADRAAEIETMADSLKDLLEERGVGDNLKISKIFGQLAISQSLLGVCFNSKATLIKVDTGAERVLLRTPYSCSAVKSFSQAGIPIVNEQGQNIIDCYNTAAKSGAMDNYFCCQNEIFPG